jgi:hypothetical protein
VWRARVAIIVLGVTAGCAQLAGADFDRHPRDDQVLSDASDDAAEHRTPGGLGRDEPRDDADVETVDADTSTSDTVGDERLGSPSDGPESGESPSTSNSDSHDVEEPGDGGSDIDAVEPIDADAPDGSEGGPQDGIIYPRDFPERCCPTQAAGLCHPSSGTVIQHPRIYIVYWGFGATTSQDTRVHDIEMYLGGVGGKSEGAGIPGTRWLGAISQYSTPTQTIFNEAGILKGIWMDDRQVPVTHTSADPSDKAFLATADVIAEVQSAVIHFGVQDQADAIVLLATGPAVPAELSTRIGALVGYHESAPNGDHPTTPFIRLPYSAMSPAILHHQLAGTVTNPRYGDGFGSARPCDTVGWIADYAKTCDRGAARCAGALPEIGDLADTQVVPYDNLSTVTVPTDHVSDFDHWVSIGQLWSNEGSGPGGPPSFHAGAVSSLAASQDVFINGSVTATKGSSLLHRKVRTYPRPEDSGFVSLGTDGADSVGSPVSTSWGNSATNGPRTDAFVYDSNGELKWIYSDDGENFAWFDLGPAPAGGTFVGRPAVATPKPWRWDVFATVRIGTRNVLYHRAWDYFENEPWSPWNDLPDPSFDPASSPSAVGWTMTDVFGLDWRLEVFYLNAANDLVYTTTSAFQGYFYAPDASMWGRWGNGGFKLTGDPSVVSWTDGRLDVFVGDTGGSLTHAWFDNTAPSAPHWAAWNGPVLGMTDLDPVSPGACHLGDRKISDWILTSGKSAAGVSAWQTTVTSGVRILDGLAGTFASPPSGRFACSSH